MTLRGTGAEERWDLTHIFNPFIELSFTYHRITHFKVHKSIVLQICVIICAIQPIFIISERNPTFLSYCPQPPPSPQALGNP